MSTRRLRQPTKYRPIRTPRHSTANPTKWIAVESEETSCPTKKPRRKAGVRVKQKVSELVGQIGFEPGATLIRINVHRAKNSCHGHR